MAQVKTQEQMSQAERNLLGGMLRRSLRAAQVRLDGAQMRVDEAQKRVDEFEAEEARIARST